jgi:hypothetical protein
MAPEYKVLVISFKGYFFLFEAVVGLEKLGCGSLPVDRLFFSKLRFATVA